MTYWRKLLEIIWTNLPEEQLQQLLEVFAQE
jgi:hypothetical protein